MVRFNEIYEKIYKEFNEPLEDMRKKIKKRNIIIFTICGLIGVVFTLLVKQIFFLFFMLVLALILSCVSKKNKEYTSFFKNKVINAFIKEYDENLNYNPEKGISNMIYNQGEFEYYDRYNSEDYIYGTLKDGYKIEMAEIHTEDESTDSDGNTTYTTLFHGLFAKVELDKYIKETIKIRRNTIKLFDTKKRLEMDSSEFEKIYDVYSEDKIATMQLLTADIMQMFIDFKNENKVTPELTIKQNNLYIRFSTGNVFEANIMKNALDYNTLKKYYDTINFTLGITEKMLKNIKETQL